MNTSLLPLYIWLSPAFPVGAFAYSHGLEWAFEAGDLRDAASAESWIGDVLAFGSGRNDAIILAAAYRAAAAGDAVTLSEVSNIALALQPSKERLLETTSQGNAFLKAVCASWPAAGLAENIQGDCAYPVAVARAAAAHDIPLAPTLELFLLAAVANLVSAAVRLGVIGQTEGQNITAALSTKVAQMAQETLHFTLDDLGGFALRSDIASMKHETQYTRLFRS